MKKTIKEKHSKKWKHLSLERVWSEFGESLEIFLSSPHERWNKKNIWAWSEFGESLKNLQTHSKVIPLFQRNNEITKNNENIWVWSELGESPNSLQTHKEIFVWYHFSKKCFFKKKRKKWVWKSVQTFFWWLHAYFFWVWRVWREFGESLEILQTHFFLFFSKKTFFFLKNDIRQRFLCEFGASLEWVWREFGESPNSLQTHKEIFAWCYFFFKDFLFWRKKMGKKMSLENLQTLSKLKKNMRSQLFFEFFWVVERIFFSKKKLWTHIFFWVWREFGESLEILQTHFFLLFFKKNWKMTSSKDFFVSLEWVWRFSKLSPNSLQTRSKLICFHFFRCFFSSLLFFLEKRNEFGVSLEILQTLSKLAPNSYVFIFLVFFFCFTFFWKRGMNLKISPNSLQTHMFSFFLYYFFYFYFFFLKKRNEFGVSLEILQTLSKLISFHFFEFTFFGQEEWVWSEFGDSPNWLQIRSKLICFHVFSILLFFGKRGMSLEWVWRFSKLSPNSLQTQMISCFIVFSLYCFFIFVWKRQTTLEWVWRFSTLSKLAPKSYVFRFFCFFLCFSIYYLFYFFGKRGMSLEWVWSEFGDSPNSPQTQMISIFFCVFSHYCYLKHFFLGREEWVWSKFGGSSNSLQTYSKLTPNSYGFILLFLLYSQLIVFFIFLKKEWVFIFFTGSF